MTKRFLLIAVMVFWCGVGFAKDLTGLILSCGGSDEEIYPEEPNHWNHLNIKFLSKHQAHVITNHGFIFYEKTESYRVFEHEISIENSVTIKRATLKIHGWKPCKIVEDENFDIKKDAEERKQKALDAQEKLNII